MSMLDAPAPAPAVSGARGLVPSERQHEAARPDELDLRPATAPTPADAPPKRGPGGLVKQWLHDADPRLIGGSKAPLVVLALSSLFAQWDDFALIVLLPDIRAEFGIGLAFLAVLGTQVQLINTAVAPLMGYLADRVKRVWMVRIGAVGANVASIAAGVAGSVPQLVLSRMGAGLSKGISDPASFPLLADLYEPKARARVMNFFFAMGALGGLAGPTLAGWLGRSFGWRSSLIALGGLASVVSLGTFFLREPKRGAIEGVASLSGDAPPPMSFAEGWRAARSVATVRRLWASAPILFIGGSGANLLLGSFFAEVYQLGPRERGYLATLTAALGLIGLIISGPVSDRLLRDRPGRVLTLMGGLIAVQALGFALMAVSPSMWLSIAATLPVALVAPVLLPAFLTLLSLVVPPRLRGFGLQSISWFTLIGIAAYPQILSLADGMGLRRGVLVFVPFLLVGAAIVAGGADGVARDIRAARAAALAERDAAASGAEGREKMVVCRDVDVSYDGVQVLFGVDFDLDEGELVALLGTNGAGKSTLLRAIAGVQSASNGAVFVDGRDVTHAPPHEIVALGVAMMPGGRATFPSLSVEENLRTAAGRTGADIDEVYGFFPVLRERRHEPAGNLSGGEQQMVGLGQALLMRPRLLMIDELSLGLAPRVVEQLLDIVAEINTRGTTVVLVEQSINVALTIARRAVFMEKGEIQFDGPTEDLLNRPDLVRAVFMGGGVSSRRGRKAWTAQSSSDQPVLAVSDVAVRFAGVQALGGVSLDVGRGEVVGIIGPNGAGKTTLFDVVSGFVAPDAGRVFIDGVDVSGLTPDARARQGLGRSFQRARLFPTLTVRETLAVAFERHASRSPLLAAVWAPSTRRSEARIAANVDALIEILGLDSLADKFVHELSTGSRRAVDVGCILASSPKIVLLDEPSSGLSQAETEELGPVVRRLARETGAGVLIIEHDLPLVTSASDRLVAMELGRVLAAGPPADVVRDPQVVSSYLAASGRAVARSGSRMSGLLEAAVIAGLGSDRGSQQEEA